MARLPQQVLLVIVLLTISGSYAQNSTNDNGASGANSKDVEVNAVNKALEPLYQMTNGFLHVVFSGVRVDTIREVIDQLDGGKQLDNWNLAQTILNGYAGYATCVVIGILILVLMPFIGCFCCCCRLCNKCGGKTHENDPKNAKCKKALCGGLLLVFTVITVGGMVMVFFSAARLHELTNDGVLQKDFDKSIVNFNNSAYKLVNEDLVKQTDDILEELVRSVDSFVDAAGETVTSSVLKLVNVEQPISSLATDLDSVNDTVDSLIEGLTRFEETRSETQNNYTTAKVKLDSTSASCGGCSNISNQMGSLIAQLQDLSVQSDLDKIEDGPKKELGKIPNLRVAYTEVNTSVADLVDSKINDSKTSIINEVNSAKNTVSKQIKDSSKTLLSTFDDVTSETSQVDNFFNDETFKSISQYLWYANLALGSVVGVITLLYLMGLLCGCGSRPGEDANCCNKGCGANFLLAAVGFTFIFYALLMLITCILFAVGSLTTSHVCWTLQNPENVVDSLKKDDFYLGNGNISLFTIVDSYSKCLNDESIESITDSLQTGFDKNSTLREVEKNIGKNQIDPIINRIPDIDTSSLDILPADLNDTLKQLDSFSELNKTFPDLSGKAETIKSNLTLLIAAVKFTSLTSLDADDKKKLDDVASYLEYSRDHGVDSMVSSGNNIQTSYAELVDDVNVLRNSSRAAIAAITDAQTQLQVNGTRIVKEALTKLGEALVDEITTDATKGVDKLFGVKCKDLAEALKGTANVACETVLNPMNGLWFSLGWSLIMLIPCLIVALFLSSLFRREAPYDGDYKDDLNRGYDGNNIPLESRHKPHYGDATNPGFRDDYGHAMYNGGGNHYMPPPYHQGPRQAFY